MSDEIHYDQLMHRAMHSLIHDLLQNVSRTGTLPGDHHFFITFNTNHPGVEISDWLRAAHPDGLTIVLQHWFENLMVMKDRFSVTVSFNERPEPLVIPFESIRSFIDPFAEFGLTFETPDLGEVGEVPESPMLVIEEDDFKNAEEPKGDAEVISLDTFRKN